MAAFRDMEELCQGLLSLLGANHAAAQQRRLLGRYGQMVERLLETQDGAEQQLRGEGRGLRGGEAGTGSRAPPPACPPALSRFPRGLAGGRALLPLSLSFPTREMGFRTAAPSRGLVMNIGVGTGR